MLPELICGLLAMSSTYFISLVTLCQPEQTLLWAHAGAFVAGLDAGHAYNTFPLMDGRLIPEEYGAMEGWRNAFENTAAVQLHHRALAMSTLGGVTALWAASRSLQLPRPCRLLVNGMLAMAGLQVGNAPLPVARRQLRTLWCS